MTPPASDSHPALSTLGELRASGWRSEPVRDELRRNVLARIAAGRPIIEGVLGFEETIIPQLENALIAGHDIILLGERGQAKSRLIRSLVELLDEWVPVLAGSEINDDPYHPVSRYGRQMVEELGDLAPVHFLHRSDRYGEKLATPDTSIADLIGEVDPIKVAEGRYLSDELTIHYGLVPRSNRGIFAINELPDLAERIQVGLLNVLEERDIQIRGHRVRLPLDLVLVASANPEDYTSRGRIITPLKDRFGAQVRTHYPYDVETEVRIVEQEATRVVVEGIEIGVPAFMSEIVARLSQAARESNRINQRSGVSVRASIANYETLVAAAIGRAVRLHEERAVPRPSDLDALLASTLGKVEIEMVEGDEEIEVVEQLLRTVVLQTFREHADAEVSALVVEAFEDGRSVEVGPEVPSRSYVALATELPGLGELASELVGAEAPPGEMASAVELVLEGLHLSRRLNKDAVAGGFAYRAR
jgi:magnesium chelatase subunit I